MKRLKYILLQLAAVVGIVTSCQDSGVDEGGSIDMSNEFSTLSFGADYTTTDDGKIVIITTSGEWTAEPNDNWIMLSADSGSAGKSSFYVGVEANYNTSTRYGTIEITSGYKRMTIIVEQSHDQYIDIARDTYSYDGREQTFSVLVSTNVGASNVEALIPSADKEWLSCSSPTITLLENNVTELNYTFKVEAQADGEEARESSVVISYSKAGVGATFTVSQNQFPTIAIEDEERSKALEYFETQTTVVVESNVTIVVEDDVEWLEVAEDYEADGNIRTYTFTLDENHTGNDRDADVNFVYYMPDGDYIDQVVLSETINIAQAAKTINIYIDPTDRTIYESTQTYVKNDNFEVKVYSNIELKAASNGDWVTIVDEYTAVDVDEEEYNGDDKIYTFTFKLTQNDEVNNDLRECYVLFTNDVDDSNALLTITQDKEQVFIEISDVLNLMESQPYTANDTFQITITSNANTIETPSIAQNWITQVGANPTGEATDISGVLSYTYTFEIEENFEVGADTRYCDITFEGDGVSDMVTITQEARVPEVTINNYDEVNGVTQLFNVGELTLNVSSDIPLSATVSGAAISPDATTNDALTTTTTDYVVTIPNNTDSANTQTFTVTFSNTDYNYTQSVVINQEVMPSTFTIENTDVGLATLLATDPEADYSTYSRVVITGTALTTDDFTALTTNFTNVAYIDISGTETVEIPASRFKSNTTLIQFLFPEGGSLTTIGANAFDGSGLTTVKIPSSVTSVGSTAFGNTSSLKSVDLTDNTVIGYRMFYLSVLTSVTIPSTITEWTMDANGYNDGFSNCKSMTSVTLESGLTTMGSRSFYACTALTSVYIPASIISWDVCTLSTITATNGTSQAFAGCSTLTYAEFEAGRTEQPSSLFNNCGSPFTLVSNSEVPPTIILPGQTVSDGAYTGTYTYYVINGGALNTAITYVPVGCVDAYSATTGWASQKYIYEIGTVIE